MGRVADALVLVSSPGVSPADWGVQGVLDREWAIYSRLGGAFERMVVVTDRPVPKREKIEQSLTMRTGSLVEIIDNHDDAERTAWLAWLGPAAARRLSGAATAVVKTNQHTAGDAALVVTDALSAGGTRVGLVARGGYPWSRFEAELRGPGSREAAEAGVREGDLCRRASVVVGTTDRMVQDLAWRHGIAREHCRVVPNYVTPADDTDETIARDPDEILYVGQLTPRKRLGLVLEAVALLASDWGEHVRMRVVGDGEEREALEQRANELGVDAVFEGRLAHRDVRARLSRCGLYVQMSSLEGHPKTVIEAMALGAAVVVADAPGLAEIVSHGVTGMCVSPDARELAQTIAGLRADEDWRQMIGRAAADWARRFSLDEIVRLELDVYGAAMERAGEHAGERSPPVRWQPALLRGAVSSAVEAWRNSLHGFAKRLPARDRACFLASLDTWVYSMQGEAAVEACGGVHPKHRLMGYHQFFAARVAEGQRVLDLGCGKGELLTDLALAGAEVVGMDASASSLEAARVHAAKAKVSERVTLAAGDITTVRAGGRFDTIILSNVLEHLKERPALLAKWLEWYQPARVLIRVPAWDREWRVPWKDQLGVDSRLDETHEVEYTREALERELAEAGLVAVSIESRWGEYWAEAAPAHAAAKAA